MRIVVAAASSIPTNKHSNSRVMFSSSHWDLSLVIYIYNTFCYLASQHGSSGRQASTCRAIATGLPWYIFSQASIACCHSLFWTHFPPSESETLLLPTIKSPGYFFPVAQNCLEPNLALLRFLKVSMFAPTSKKSLQLIHSCVCVYVHPPHVRTHFVSVMSNLHKLCIQTWIKTRLLSVCLWPACPLLDLTCSCITSNIRTERKVHEVVEEEKSY